MRRSVLGAGSIRQSAICASAQPVSGGTYPLSVSGNTRYLQTAGGSPRFLVADSPHGMFVNLAATDNVTSTDAGAFWSARRAQGFNAAWVEIVAFPYTFGRADGSTFDGILPFNSTIAGGQYDITNPNPTYWARIDAHIQLAANYGFLIFLDPMETGGWLTTMVNNGPTSCNTYGQFLGNRYKSFSNILWLSGNDYNQSSAPTTTQDNSVKAIAQGLRTTNPVALQSVEFYFFESDSYDDAVWPPLIDVNSVYWYGPQYTGLRRGYNRTSPKTMPTVYVEGSYEHEQNDPANTPLGNPLEIRRQAYYSLTNGATGFFYGEHNVSAQLTGWQNYLGSPNSPGADHVHIFALLLGTIAWHTLIPDQGSTFLTGGTGTSGTVNYATAALSADGHLGVAYTPAANNMVLNLAGMAGPVTATWHDPANGATSSAGTGLTGSHTFTHPGANSFGDSDWVLVLGA